jgi:hypothetical protein
MGYLTEAVNRVFGWEIKRPAEAVLPSFTPKSEDDGAVIVAAGGTYGTYVDLEGSVRNEAQLVTKYRDMNLHAEVDSCVNQITNEAIVQEEDTKIVEIILDDLPGLPQAVKQAIEAEFDAAQELLEFNTHAYDIFRRFYIDGRLYFHAIIDEKQPEAGIQELRYIDPRKIRKVREVVPYRDKYTKQIPGAEVIQTTKNEYFIYNPSGFITNSTPSYTYATPATGLKIAKDAIVHITSGITDSAGTLVLGYLHKAIKPLNQLRALEDATIIYRLARAPERRIFYIDVGDLPKQKADQYLRDMMQRYKNRLVYDSESGAIRDDRKYMTMLEDFWFPRRGDSRGTEIDTLPAGNAQGVLEEVEFFKQRLYAALNVPFTRTDPEAMGGLGTHMTEITRDEITFAKFIDRTRLRFNQLFLKILEKQLILKQIIKPEEWKPLAYRIKFKYAKENIFAEIKEREILNDKYTTLGLIAPFIGMFVSRTWVRKNLLKQTDEDIERIDAEIAEEMNDPIYQQAAMQGMLGMPGMGPGGATPGMGGPQPGGGDGGDGPPAAAQPKQSINKKKDKGKK